MFCNMATQAAIVSMSILDDGKSDSVVESVLNNDRMKITMTDYPHYVFMINMNRPRYASPRNFFIRTHTRIEKMVYHRRVDTAM